MLLSELGVSAKKEAQFNKRGIFSAEDLVAYLPTKYKDFSHETGILPKPEVSCVLIKPEKMEANHASRVPHLTIWGKLYRTGEAIRVVFWHQNFLYKKLQPFIGSAVFFAAGKIEYNPQFRNYTMSGPELFEPLTQDVKKIYPTYKSIPGMSQDYLAEKMKLALSMPDSLKETLPFSTIESQQLMTRKEALWALHHPQSFEQIAKAQERMLFEDLLHFALHVEWASKTAIPVSPVMLLSTERMEQLRSQLPFALTTDQAAAVEGMLAEAKQNHRINALLQGDVGSGKTIVAILMMVAMAENGYQAVLMAPTQVLARQHYVEIKEMLEPYGFQVAFLGANQKKKERGAILKAIKTGEAQIVVGTHSCIAEDVEYHRLGMTIADEEHKFGVSQRSALVAKAADGVHTLTMSATPIPRTLAQVVYGNAIQLHTIRTMPNGRKPVITGRASTKQKLFSFILREAKQGHQTYVVCPLIDASEKMEGVKSVEEIGEFYDSVLSPYGVRVATLTGRNSQAETEEIIAKFQRNEINVLVSTTVVEVGVNVPTATLMVVSNAERFGLASLHQLRGRVGRSNLQAYCVLDCGENLNEVGEQRIDAMCSTSDGFEIAKTDLKIRGAGDFLGTKQSGESKYFSLMLAYPEKYAIAQQVARQLIAEGSKCPLMQQVKTEQAEIVSV